MYIAIDIGGTNMRIGFAEKTDKPEFFAIEKFTTSHDVNNDLKKIFELIDRYSSGKTILGIGIGIAGTIDQEKIKLARTTNIPEWMNVNIIDVFIKKYNCPVWVENDVVVAASSELYNSDRHESNSIYLAWGTGIGGAELKKEGVNIAVKEIDYNLYIKEFESKCGGKKIGGRFGKPIADLTEEEWDKVMSDFEEGIIKLSSTFNIKSFIVAGGVALKQRDRVEDAAKKLEEKSIHLEISKFDDNATLYGALAFINLNESHH